MTMDHPDQSGLDLNLLTGCWEWVVGFSYESCDETCAEVNR
eukprot:CAMPEP_0181291662 /NCGR_PEP_ID=MMETSP1101-20121128/2088_1 /TAXON_ID=46948 /ORGANISM="Rhodomonas abbreviata, Strain Caron Lab Isolate" /LENGTH=40 /DNA_ID= /DNA_START= /DNA_END= /DNA_ORIENTATION=